MKTKTQNSTLSITSSTIETPLGKMYALTDDKALYALAFKDLTTIQKELEEHALKRGWHVTHHGSTTISSLLTTELNAYFEGTLRNFSIPISLDGSPFQKNVWQNLMAIPYGTTYSYSTVAQMIGKPSACRAVGNANGANHLAIVVPCHRIVNADGTLGGYASGIDRKKWLLRHEGHYSCSPRDTLWKK